MDVGSEMTAMIRKRDESKKAKSPADRPAGLFFSARR
jgi:hypothetical protein